MIQVVFTSGLQKISTGECTVLVTYSNRNDCLNTHFYTENPFEIRIKASFFHERVKETTESEEISTGEILKLQGTIKTQKLLTVEPIPYYLAETLKKISILDNISIDGIDVLSEETSEYKQLNSKYPFVLLELWLTLKDSFRFN